ncbi:HAMP domain-containing sensor histidine kinase [Actinoplanes sp. CA-054009]
MARRSSLLLRLFALSAVVSLLSVGATAYLAVRTTTRAIEREQVQALADDAKIYDALLGYAATHADWSGVTPLVRSLAGRTGHRIALTDRAHVPLSDSASGALPAKASATIDPLAAGGEGIDPRAVGPYRLTAGERATLRALAAGVAGCLREPPPGPAAEGAARALPRTAVIVDEPSGRPRVETPGSDPATDFACARPRAALAEPTDTEKAALARLGALVNGCLAGKHAPAVDVGLGGTWTWAADESARSGRQWTAAVTSCLGSARREQLGPYVAPAALVFVTSPGERSHTVFDLSPGNQARIAGVAALVLLAALGVTALVGVRLVRPLRALTAAAGRMGDDGPPVRVSGRDEIARLAGAFNDMAERRRHLERLRRAMVGDVAHEMRTPVTNIRGWLEAAEDGVVPLDRQLVTSLLEEAVQLQHVIDDLQDLAAADAGELRLHPEPVEVAELLRAVADAFAATADRAGVTLAVEAGPAVVTADPVRLRQAVSNLVANAVRHTPARGRVTLSLRTEGNELAIDVADTGPGIPAAQRAMVFERFWRADKSRNRESGGSGLGLSIVRKLAEAHGGAVGVDGAPGGGAVFTLRLPAS